MTPQEAPDPLFNNAQALSSQWIMEAMQETKRVVSGAPKAVSIRKGPKEPYSDFIDRLYSQIDLEVSREDLREYLKGTMSIQNANDECKKLLRNLRPEDSLDDKMYACREFGSTDYKMEMLAEALKVGNEKGSSNTFKGNCHKCGKRGHMAEESHGREATRPPLKCYN